MDQFQFVRMCSANIPADVGSVVAAAAAAAADLATRLSLHHAQFPAFQALKSYEVRTVVHQSV